MADDQPDLYKRKSACRCWWVQVDGGPKLRMVEVHPECVYHQGVLLEAPEHMKKRPRPE